MGAGRVRQLPGRAARHRHRPSGERRVPRPRRLPGHGRRRAERRVSRHARRHGLAHDHGERSGRRRVGRRRHRSRGGDAGAADFDADPGSDRLPPGRRAAGGGYRDRPRADNHRAPPAVRRGRQVRGVLRSGARLAHRGGPRDPRQHVAGVRVHRGDLPDRPDDARLPHPDRTRSGARRAGGGLREGAGPLRHPRRRSGLQRRDRLPPRHGGAEPGGGPGDPRTGCPCGAPPRRSRRP